MILQSYDTIRLSPCIRMKQKDGMNGIRLYTFVLGTKCFWHWINFAEYQSKKNYLFGLESICHKKVAEMWRLQFDVRIESYRIPWFYYLTHKISNHRCKTAHLHFFVTIKHILKKFKVQYKLRYWKILLTNLVPCLPHRSAMYCNRIFIMISNPGGF